MTSFGLQLKKQYIKQWGNDMLKALLAKAIKKHGLKAILIKVGDVAVKATKTKDDDKLSAKVKKVLDTL